MKTINATYGKETIEVIIDETDYEFLNRHHWLVGSNGYAKTTLGNKPVLMHDIVFGTKQSGKVIDHINRNKLDNRKENLRQISVWHNAVNRGKMKPAERKYKSPYVGVFHKKDGENVAYEAGMSIKGKYFYVKRCKNEYEAALNRDAFAYMVHGHLAFLNFPEKEEEYKNWEFPTNLLNRYEKWK